MGDGEGAKPVGIARAGIIFGTVLALTVQSIDVTIAAVALPHMQGSLSASQDEINWVITSYIVAVAIMTAPAGWLAARYGRKRILIASVAGFTIASVLTGFAQSLDQVVLSRFLQGALGAPLVPLSQSLLLDVHEPKDGMKAMAWWSMGGIIGPIIGPNLGGWITENWDWRWVFFINVPIGVLCLVFMASFLTETRKLRSDFDWLGFASLSLFITCFQLVMDRGSEKDWFGSTEIISEACLACFGLYIFVVHSMTTTKSFIDFGTLRDWNFGFGLIFTFFNSMVFISSMVMLPSFMQNILGIPVGLSGNLLTPRSLGSAITVILMGRLGSRFDPRLMAVIGLSGLAYETYVMAHWNLNVSPFEVSANGFFQGFATAISFVAMQSLIFSGITPERRGGAATIYGLVRNFGQSFGVSGLTALLVHGVQANHADLAAQVTPFNRALHSGAPAHFWNLGHMAGRVALDAEIGRQSALIAYIDDFKVMAFLVVAAMPMVFMLRLPKHVDGKLRPKVLVMEE